MSALATVAAADWWAHTRSHASAWIDDYKNSLHRPYRTLIAEIVQHYAPSSLFEIGCHCGPNLVRLAQDVPSLTDVFGIDPSAQAIEAGRAWMAETGLADRVHLSVGRFPENTAGMASGCADVVLSCYTLAYLSPEDLDAALFEIGRLAAKAVILAEPVSSMDTVSLAKTPTGYQEYAHAYGKSLKWIGSLRGMTFRMVDVTPPQDHLNAILVLERV